MYARRNAVGQTDRLLARAATARIRKAEDPATTISKLARGLLEPPLFVHRQRARMKSLELLILIFAWSGVSGSVPVGTSKLQIHIPKSLYKTNGYDHRDALFGTPPYGGSIQAQLYYTDQSLCTTADPHRGYPERETKNDEMLPWQSPFVLMIDRGDCTFVAKVRNAQRAGATAVLIADNTCLCVNQDTCDNEEGASCENQEPIMADDGSGNDISIPTFLVFKQDADVIKHTLKDNKQVRVEMAFAVPTNQDSVTYDLWSTPVDPVSMPIERNFKAAAVALGDKAHFSPKMYIYDGMKAGCSQNGEDECYNLCTNSGRYCAVDPDDDLDEGLSGADVVTESLRRLCVWQVYGENNGVGKEYWSYIEEFLSRCYDPENELLFKDETCIKNAMTRASVDSSLIESCMADSGGLEGDVANKILDQQLADKEKSGIILIPSLIVNGAPIRGELSLATALKAICSGYSRGSEPPICDKCAMCNDVSACVKHGSCLSGFSQAASVDGVSSTTFAGTLLVLTVLAAVTGYIQHRRQQRVMREQVRGILAQYMPLDEDQAHTDTSVGIEQDGEGRSEFTIT
ncbi:hypothetical protein MPSEU_000285500 [Mayamaea pseudoterrestris]|nr:hypothetical protein MPSEU_000285500 [Mayamaea pseudoterrestris]